MARKQVTGVLVAEQTNVVLFWPLIWSAVEWYGESGVTGVEPLTNWLERAYVQMVGWRQMDPNGHYELKNGDRHRLAFVCNGKRDFQYGGVRRPYIGLPDRIEPRVGSKDWFGWLCHELSHDFFHEPRLGPDAEEWGDGLCDYFRYQLLRSLGMPRAAQEFHEIVVSAQPTDSYGQPAKLLLPYQHLRRLLV